MTEIQQYAYWMAFAHLPRWKTEKINRLIADILQERKLSFSEFFDLDKADLEKEFQFYNKELADIEAAKSELPNYSFLAEDLLNQGFELIPINSDDYSQIMKQNLKLKYSPPLLYVKGNKKLLKESSIAIVGSRKASDISLQFTKNVTELGVRNHEVVVSGFAKGVDRTALEETLKANGRSIIVLPQGIMTFANGFKKYYTQIVDGDVLVLSTYHPKAPWSVGLAMGRNTYIYGLAGKIFVAESDSKGGTWAGVSEGLRKGRKVYVRIAGKKEKNANNLLMLKGAVPVDMNGDVQQNTVLESFKNKIKKLISNSLSADEIRDNTDIDIDSKELSKIISGFSFVKTEKKNGKNIFSLKTKHTVQTSMF